MYFILMHIEAMDGGLQRVANKRLYYTFSWQVILFQMKQFEIISFSTFLCSCFLSRPHHLKCVCVCVCEVRVSFISTDISIAPFSLRP